MTIPKPPIVTRQEWSARSPRYTNSIAMPTPELWLHHSASQGEDEKSVKAIQDYHMDDPKTGWSDIAYTFLIDNDTPDIDIFEGRGPGIQGGHTAGHNTVSSAICVLGNFNSDTPSEDMLEKLAWLAAYGYQEGWWCLGFSGGHRDTRGGASGDCPGNKLYDLIPKINSRIIEIVNGGLMSHNPTEYNDYMEAHQYDHKTSPDWMTEAYEVYVADGGSSVANSHAWGAVRGDIAYMYTKLVKPLATTVARHVKTLATLTNDVKALKTRMTEAEKEIAALKASGIGGQDDELRDYLRSVP